MADMTRTAHSSSSVRLMIAPRSGCSAQWMRGGGAACRDSGGCHCPRSFSGTGYCGISRVHVPRSAILARPCEHNSSSVIIMVSFGMAARGATLFSRGTITPGVAFRFCSNRSPRRLIARAPGIRRVVHRLRTASADGEIDIDQRRQNERMSQIERAIRYVKGLLRTRGYESDGRLPPLNALARDAGVARMTMYTALRQLKDQSLVRLEHGRGIFAAHGAAGAHDQTRQPLSAFERTTAKLQSDILSHVHAPGAALPTRKELCRRYSCGMRTLDRALRHLCRQHLLVHWGRRYRVGQSQVRSEYATLIAVMRSAETGGNELLLTSPRARERYHRLESTCELFGLRLVVAPFHYSYRGTVED
ncbi:MAG: GntR family transcriptional regulator, partial [Chitinivibrionales bacterium]|nr:GntR family transcriptional regulator [Chitinivibrionales bacterium]